MNDEELQKIAKTIAEELFEEAIERSWPEEGFEPFFGYSRSYPIILKHLTKVRDAQEEKIQAEIQNSIKREKIYDEILISDYSKSGEIAELEEKLKIAIGHLKSAAQYMRDNGHDDAAESVEIEVKQIEEE